MRLRRGAASGKVSRRNSWCRVIRQDQGDPWHIKSRHAAADPVPDAAHSPLR
jgi:hypothetical protein